MTEHDEFDDLTSSFSTLATLEVPRDLDPATISAAGHRRVIRRRWITSLSAIGGAAVATAAVAVLATGTGATGTQPPIAGGPTTVAAGTTPAPSLGATNQPASTTPQPGGPTNRPGGSGDPMDEWTRSWERFLVALKVPINTTHGSMSDSTSAETQTSVIRGKATGYVAMAGTIDPKKVTSARQATSCPIVLYPVDGTGQQCQQHSDAQGTYWVKTYADSYQGPTTIVQVVGSGSVVTASQSQGFPEHQINWDDSTKNVLPWDGRDPISENGPFKKHPTLDSMPLTLAQQVSLARSLVIGR